MTYDIWHYINPDDANPPDEPKEPLPPAVPSKEEVMERKTFDLYGMRLDMYDIRHERYLRFRSYLIMFVESILRTVGKRGRKSITRFDRLDGRVPKCSLIRSTMRASK